jgi:hypothetical protein
VTPELPAPGLTRGLRRPREAPDQVRGGHPDQPREAPDQPREAPDQVRGGVASTTRNVKATRTLTRSRNPLKMRAWPSVPQWADRKGYPG